MKLYFAFIIICGMMLGSCTSSSIQNNQSFDVKELKDTRAKNDEPKVPGMFFGTWGGTGGGLIKVTPDTFANALDNETYDYKVIDAKIGKDANKYLLKLIQDPEPSYIKKFILLERVKDDHIYYFGYDTYEDFQQNAYSGAAEFFKNVN